MTGDVLFVGGCGRTDFQGGDTAEMWQSLQRLHAAARGDARLPGPQLRRHAHLDHRPRDRAATLISAARRSRSSAPCASASERRERERPALKKRAGLEAEHLVGLVVGRPAVFALARDRRADLAGIPDGEAQHSAQRHDAADGEEHAGVEPGAEAAPVLAERLETAGRVGLVIASEAELRPDDHLARRKRDVKQRAHIEVELEGLPFLARGDVSEVDRVHAQLAVDREAGVQATTHQRAERDAGMIDVARLAREGRDADVRQREEPVRARRRPRRGRLLRIAVRGRRRVVAGRRLLVVAGRLLLVVAGRRGLLVIPRRRLVPRRRLIAGRRLLVTGRRLLLIPGGGCC